MRWLYYLAVVKRSPKLRIAGSNPYKGPPLEGSNYGGKKGKSGPAIGNLNSTKNGTRIDRRRLVVGELPRELLAVRREGRAYRRQLEAETLQRKGEIDITAAHLIDTATGATLHAGICRHLLRQKIKTMSTGDILACSREMTKAKQARDAAVKALGLDQKPEPLTLTAYVNGHADGAAGVGDK